MEAGYKVQDLPLFDRKVYMSTLVREKMVKGESWTTLVPKAVADFILGNRRRKQAARFSPNRQSLLNNDYVWFSFVPVTPSQHIRCNQHQQIDKYTKNVADYREKVVGNMQSHRY